MISVAPFCCSASPPVPVHVSLVARCVSLIACRLLVCRSHTIRDSLGRRVSSSSAATTVPEIYIYIFFSNPLLAAFFLNRWSACCRRIFGSGLSFGGQLEMVFEHKVSTASIRYKKQKTFKRWIRIKELLAKQCGRRRTTCLEFSIDARPYRRPLGLSRARACARHSLISRMKTTNHCCQGEAFLTASKH